MKKISKNYLPPHSIERSVSDRILAGETMITLSSLPPESARHIVTALARWYRSIGADHDSDAVVDSGRCEASGWTDATPVDKCVEWRVIVPTQY